MRLILGGAFLLLIWVLLMAFSTNVAADLTAASDAMFWLGVFEFVVFLVFGSYAAIRSFQWGKDVFKTIEEKLQ
jgi:hypothetical protein